MQYQPIIDTHLEHLSQTVNSIMYYMRDKDETLDLDAPYQRGHVWDEHLQRLLWWSLISRVPVGSLFFNRRSSIDRYHVVDGKQRITAIMAFVDGELDLPRLWFPPRKIHGGTAWSEDVKPGDSEMVYYDDLTKSGQFSVVGQSAISIITTSLPTVEDEAMLFGMVNSGGVAQTPEDITRADAIAKAASVAERAMKAGGS